jgi:hypothetical protein
MTEPRTLATASAYDVDVFSRRFHLEQSLRLTAELIREAFGDSLADTRIAVVDDIAEEDEVEQMVVVDIVFQGDPRAFRIAYDQLISRWVKCVPPEDHKMIQFRFHIDGR